MRKVIVFYGSSLNPPTVAHQAIVADLVEMYKHRDVEILLAPVFEHAFGSKKLAPFDTRMEMAELTFGDMPNVVISDIEKTVKEATPEKRIGTIDVLQALRDAHPDVEIHLALGADTAHDLLAGKWIGKGDLLKLCDRVIVVERDGKSLQRDEKTGKPLSTDPAVSEVVDATRTGIFAYHTVEKLKGMEGVSSTKVRSGECPEGVVPPVLGYIQENRLYFAAEPKAGDGEKERPKI